MNSFKEKVKNINNADSFSQLSLIKFTKGVVNETMHLCHLPIQRHAEHAGFIFK